MAAVLSRWGGAARRLGPGRTWSATGAMRKLGPCSGARRASGRWRGSPGAGGRRLLSGAAEVRGGRFSGCKALLRAGRVLPSGRGRSAHALRRLGVRPGDRRGLPGWRRRQQDFLPQMNADEPKNRATGAAARRPAHGYAAMIPCRGLLVPRDRASDRGWPQLERRIRSTRTTKHLSTTYRCNNEGQRLIQIALIGACGRSRHSTSSSSAPPGGQIAWLGPPGEGAVRLFYAQTVAFDLRQRLVNN